MAALSMALRATPTNVGPGKLRCRRQTCRNLSISILPPVPRTSSLFSIGLAFQDSSSRPCASPALIEALHSSNCSDGLAPVDEYETSSPETSPELGRAHVGTPVTNAQLVCRLRLEK